MNECRYSAGARYRHDKGAMLSTDIVPNQRGFWYGRRSSDGMNQGLTSPLTFQSSDLEEPHISNTYTSIRVRVGRHWSLENPKFIWIIRGFFSQPAIRSSEVLQFDICATRERAVWSNRFPQCWGEFVSCIFSTQQLCNGR